MESWDGWFFLKRGKLLKGEWNEWFDKTLNSVFTEHFVNPTKKQNERQEGAKKRKNSLSLPRGGRKEGINEKNVQASHGKSCVRGPRLH